MNMDVILSAASDTLVNVLLAVITLGGAYALYYLKLGAAKVKAQTAQIESQQARQLLDDALGDVLNLVSVGVGAMEQTTAKALRQAVKDGKADREKLLALREAAKKLGGWRLLGCNLYVTAEPCAMCAGAIVWARIHRLYIGTMDPKGGACGSVFNIPQEPRLNHYVEIETGIMQQECQNILKAFFKELRKKKSEEG